MKPRKISILAILFSMICSASVHGLTYRDHPKKEPNNPEAYEQRNGSQIPISVLRSGANLDIIEDFQRTDDPEGTGWWIEPPPPVKEPILDPGTPTP